LAGEVAIVTGSTAGLGVEVARRFAAEGASVVITGRSAERGEAVAASIDGEAAFVAADLSSEAAASALVGAAVERYGSLTVLVNNAVYVDEGGGSVLDVDTAAWDRAFRVNVTAPMWLCRAAIPHLRAAGHGSIVNVSSRAAERASRGMAAYVASKGALNALTRSVAVDFAADAIRCNTISPGYVLNDRRDATITDDQRATREAMHLLGLGAADDVAWLAVYLASSESRWLTGVNVPLDGGSSYARARVLG
jgi:NAD(P)-dependent dehydrogenase (short-subunit alcohol dehydrogenase family)